MVNIPLVRFIGAPTRQERTGSIHGDWDTNISVTVVMAMGLPVDEKLSDIGMNARRAVIKLEYDGE